MSVELYKLIKNLNNMDITLAAGEKGMHNIVRWVHMVETTEASSFLQGGEIAFATGFGLSNRQTLLELAKSIYNNNAAGLILNTGPFLEKISDDVLEFGNKNNFPIFIVPWKIHLAEIMRIFCLSILKDEQKNIEISAAFKNAIFFPKQEELYVIQLSQRGFNISWHYAVCVINLKNSKDSISKKLNSIIINLENHMAHNYNNFAIFLHNTEIFIILANYSSEELHSYIEELINHLKILLNGRENFTIGIGKQTKSIRCLCKSYRQAKNIQTLQTKNKIDKSLIFYSDMGIFKLLMNIEDSDILYEYYEHTIKPIQEHDKKNDSSLVAVLRSYLKNNGSVKETADELFIHRNTVNYKINKIEELLNMDLSSLDSRIQLSVGLMLKDML
ncbi:PucR family transcriptional regulator [Clostridium sp. BJN0001]|uniref:PucR family transcriptional regulator n=1 Tax=Clostridium sp. BJN0001 TaxID=2930219 RepID=UPI001FD0DD99|nr:PucR family transcriptional regulator [Clostridium sp. BJN0001]